MPDADADALRLPESVITMADVVHRVINSPEYLACLDEDQRTWMLVEGICDELHPLGPISLPTAASVLAELGRGERNEEMRREFDGRNLAHLARKHKMSKRHARRIVIPEKNKR